jgi:hypothetical protein
MHPVNDVKSYRYLSIRVGRCSIAHEHGGDMLDLIRKKNEKLQNSFFWSTDLLRRGNSFMKVTQFIRVIILFQNMGFMGTKRRRILRRFQNVPGKVIEEKLANFGRAVFRSKCRISLKYLFIGAFYHQGMRVS